MKIILAVSALVFASFFSLNAEAAYDPLKVPGGDSPIGNSQAADRLKVFPNLTGAPAWQVVFDKATHMSFGERDMKGNSEIGNRYHKPILALTTAFWDAQLRSDKEAKAWLNGSGAHSVLDPKDKWDLNTKAKNLP